jgi:hypothetical protein
VPIGIKTSRKLARASQSMDHLACLDKNSSTFPHHYGNGCNIIYPLIPRPGWPPRAHAGLSSRPHRPHRSRLSSKRRFVIPSPYTCSPCSPWPSSLALSLRFPWPSWLPDPCSASPTLAPRPLPSALPSISYPSYTLYSLTTLSRPLLLSRPQFPVIASSIDLGHFPPPQ